MKNGQTLPYRLRKVCRRSIPNPCHHFANRRFWLTSVPTIRELGISVERNVILANLQLLHRRKIRRSHVQHVYFFHKFADRFGVLSHQLLKIWVGSHSIPVLFRFLPAGMSNEENEGVGPSGRLFGYPVTHNLEIVFGE